MPRILKNMQSRFETAAKANQKTYSKKNSVDTLAAALEVTGKNFGDVPVGGGMEFDIPEGTTGKKRLATIRGRLVAVTREGQPWAGRVFSTMLDAAGEVPKLLVMRREDGKPLPPKAGGRKTNAQKAIDDAAKAAAAHAQPEAPMATNDGKGNIPTKPEPVVGKVAPRSRVKDLTGGSNKQEQAAA